MRVASIDIGSNSVLLLIAEKTPEGVWTRVEEHTNVTRIAQGLDATGVLSEAAIDRTFSVLRSFVTRARVVEVDDIVLTGTAPFRRAENGRAVAARFERAFDVPFHIASGHEEGALTLRATLDSFPQFERLQVLDIGGASTELMHKNANSVQSQSVDIGVVRLLEQFVDQDPPTHASGKAMQEYVEQRLAEELQPCVAQTPIVGVGGTITSLAALDLKLEAWDPDAVQGHVLSTQAIYDLGQQLWSMSIQERCDILGVDPRRADVIGVGARYLHAMCKHLNANEIIVSDRGLRWGAIFVWDEEQTGEG